MKAKCAIEHFILIFCISRFSTSAATATTACYWANERCDVQWSNLYNFFFWCYDCCVVFVNHRYHVFMCNGLCLLMPMLFLSIWLLNSINKWILCKHFLPLEKLNIFESCSFLYFPFYIATAAAVALSFWWDVWAYIFNRQEIFYTCSTGWRIVQETVNIYSLQLRMCTRPHTNQTDIFLKVFVWPNELNRDIFLVRNFFCVNENSGDWFIHRTVFFHWTLIWSWSVGAFVVAVAVAQLLIFHSRTS